jgi:hypothetical protein
MGVLVGSEFPIVADAGNQFISPVVFGGGKYLAVWTSGDSLGGSVGDVYAAFIQPHEYAADFDGDGDVDGSDLSDLIIGIETLDIAAFALDFGRGN